MRPSQKPRPMPTQQGGDMPPGGQVLPQAVPLQGAGELPRAQPVSGISGSAPRPVAAPAASGSMPLPIAAAVSARTGGISAASTGPQAAAGPLAARPVPVVAPSGTLPLAVRQPEAEAEEEISTIALKNAPPWLVSAAFHMALLIILGLIVMAAAPRRAFMLDVSIDDEEDIWAEKLGEQLEYDSPLGRELIDAVEEPILTPDNLPEVEDPFAAPLNLPFEPDGLAATSDIQANLIGLALKGRQEGMRRTLLGRYGGNRLTEEAVLAGLAWLARQQQANGSWSLCGPYSSGVPSEWENPEAATAMALLAFQGHGDTHKEGEYRRNVARGWEWLLKQQDADGNFFHQGAFNHHFYTQGQCTIALCELYGMTEDEKFKEPAMRAIQYLVDSQAPEGGWRYSPKTDSDVSVTGWIVMALQSARMAGLEVPQDTLTRVERFLDRVALHEGARYGYQKGSPVSLAMTAEALLCRQYLGWPRDDARLVAGVEWITAPGNLIDFSEGNRDVYYWYYATQVAHHMEGDYWKRWNEVMKEQMIKHQVKPPHREAGSWDPERPSRDAHGPNGGRLYVTCLSIYMLEVYYRHLPIYAGIYSDLFRSGRKPGM